MIRAIVRIREQVVKTSPIDHAEHTYPAGEELAMVRWGAGRDTWWTSFDIDAAHGFRNDQVDVLFLTHNEPALGQPEILYHATLPEFRRHDDDSTTQTNTDDELGHGWNRTIIDREP